MIVVVVRHVPRRVDDATSSMTVFSLSGSVSGPRCSMYITRIVVLALHVIGHVRSSRMLLDGRELPTNSRCDTWTAESRLWTYSNAAVGSLANYSPHPIIV